MPKTLKKKNKLIISKKNTRNNKIKSRKNRSNIISKINRNKRGGSKKKVIKGKRKSNKKIRGRVKMMLRKRILRRRVDSKPTQVFQFEKVKTNDLLTQRGGSSVNPQYYTDIIFSLFNYDRCNCPTHQWLRENNIKQHRWQVETQTLRGILPVGPVMPKYTSSMREKMVTASSLDLMDDIFTDIERSNKESITCFKALNNFFLFEDYELNAEFARFLSKFEFNHFTWSTDINYLIQKTNGFCPYCGAQMDIQNATGEHSHGRILIHYLTKSLDPEENIYCVIPMCNTCNKPNNPPSVIVSGDNIKIFQRNTDRILLEDFEPRSYRHNLIFRMCLYRDLVSFLLMETNQEIYLKHCHDNIGTVHLAKLLVSVFNPITQRPGPSPDEMDKIISLYSTSNDKEKVKGLAVILEKSTLSKSIKAISDLHNKWLGMIFTLIPEETKNSVKQQDIENVIFWVKSHIESAEDLITLLDDATRKLQTKLKRAQGNAKYFEIEAQKAAALTLSTMSGKRSEINESQTNEGRTAKRSRSTHY